MKRWLSVFLALMLIISLTGCETLAKKFRRKKKEPVKAPRIYQIKKYEKKPTPELYKKHYAYWETWQSELIQFLGKNHKKDMQCIEQIVSNLEDMQNILVKEKADELATHINRLIEVKDIITSRDLNTGDKSYVLMTLEREDRYIKSRFYYDKVRKYLKKSFDEDQTQAG